MTMFASSRGVRRNESSYSSTGTTTTKAETVRATAAERFNQDVTLVVGKSASKQTGRQLKGLDQWIYLLTSTRNLVYGRDDQYLWCDGSGRTAFTRGKVERRVTTSR